MNPELVCGVDEAGRGPLAGPVYAAAVILRSDHTIMGLADSKALSALQRERLSEEIRANALAWAVAFATVEEIDRLNILQASLLAMRSAVAALSVRPVKALVDGNRDPRLDCLTETMVKGDATVPAISAASILAKVDRDTEMLRLHALHPAYGLDRHKGYPTKQHLAAIRQHGVCEIHRRSFGPVRRVLQEGTGG